MRTSFSELQTQASSLQSELQSKNDQMTALSEEKEKLKESLTQLSSEKSSSIEELESRHKEEVKKLKLEIRQAKKMAAQSEEEWKTKLEELLVASNVEHERLVQENLAKSSEVSEMNTLKQQLADLQSQQELLKSSSESGLAERDRERETNLSRISQLELQLSQTQEHCEKQVAEIKKKAETRLAAMKRQCEEKLQEKGSEFDSWLLEMQLELERKYSQEKAQLSAEGVSISKQHEQQLRNVEERYSFEISDLKRALNVSRSELQEAKDRLLGEGEKFSKLERQLVELQSSHQVEIDALKSQHQQEMVEHTAQYSGAGLEAESLRQQHEEEKQELLEQLRATEENLSSQQNSITR